MIAIEMIEKLKKEELASITVLSGEDFGQYGQMKKLFFNKIGFEPSDLNFSYFDMSETSYQDAEMDLESLPFFADEKIVIFDNFADITTDKKTFLNNNELKRFEAYLGNPLSSTKLVICASGKVLKETELRTYFQKRAHKDGLFFESGVFESLLIKSNFDFSEVAKNLTFLTSYKKDGHIRAQDISETIPKTLQDNIFDLTQFILTGQIDAARDLIRDLRLQGEDEIKLIAVMLGQFRMFTQIKILSGQNKSETQIVTALSDYLGRKVNPYQVKFALRDSRTLTLPFLKKAVTLLIETDYAIKSGTYDKDYLFDVALLKLAHENRG